MKVFVHIRGNSSGFAKQTWDDWKPQVGPIDRHVLAGVSRRLLPDLEGSCSHLRPKGHPEIGPAFLTASYLVYRELEALPDEEITVFAPTTNGVLYCIANARHLGFSKKKWTLVAVDSGTARSKAHEKGHLFGAYRDLCHEFMESYVHAHCDETLGEGPPPAQLSLIERRCRRNADSKKGETPRLDVIIAHYNRSDVIVHTLDGYRRQTYPNFSITIVDDGSTAEHFSRLKELSQSYDTLDVRVVRKQNGYLGAARNHGVALTSGEYVVFNDDDNIPLPHMLEWLVRALQRSGADIVTCAMKKFESKSGTPERKDMGSWAYLGGALPAALFHNTLGDANSICRRSVFDTLTFHTEHGVGHEDYEFFVQALLLGMHIESICEPCFEYRKDMTSMLHTTVPVRNLARHLSAFQTMDISEVQAILMEAALHNSIASQGPLSKHVRSRLKTSYMRMPKPLRKVARALLKQFVP